MFQKKLKRDLADELGLALQNRQENLSRTKRPKNSRKRLLLINEAQIETLKNGTTASDSQHLDNNSNPYHNSEPNYSKNTSNWQISSLKTPQTSQNQDKFYHPYSAPTDFETNQDYQVNNNYDYLDRSSHYEHNPEIVGQETNVPYYENDYFYNSPNAQATSESISDTPKKSYLGHFLLTILIILILAGLGLASFSWWQNQNTQSKKTAAQCQELINQEKDLGLSLECQKIDFSIWGLWANRSLASNLSQNQQKIETTKSALAKEIDTLQKAITVKTTKMDSLQIALPPNSNSSESTNLTARKAQALATLTELDKALLTNLQQKAAKLDQMIKDNQDISKDLELETYQNFLTNLQQKAGFTSLNSNLASVPNGNQNVDFSLALPSSAISSSTNTPSQVDLADLTQEVKVKTDELQVKIDQYLAKSPEQSQIRLSKLYQTLTGAQFKEIYNNFKYSKVGPIAQETIILDDPDADAYIARIAEKRGYVKRPQAEEGKLEKVETQRLHTEAKVAFEKLKTEAKKEGLDMVLVSGYRSVSEQRDIFVQRLGNLANSETIKSGQSDDVLDSLLQTTSVPGYSRHHTGYTFDLGCGSNNLIIFKDTECYQWLSKDNYFNAKRFGLIPSYPVGAGLQGPDPEAWEYVWVGTEILQNK